MINKENFEIAREFSIDRRMSNKPTHIIVGASNHQIRADLANDKSLGDENNCQGFVKV